MTLTCSILIRTIADRRPPTQPRISVNILRSPITLSSTTRFGYFFQNYHDFDGPPAVRTFSGRPIVITHFDGVNQLPTALQYNAGHSSSAYDGTNTLYNANKHIQLNQAFFLV